jgi:CreA protein
MMPRRDTRACKAAGKNPSQVRTFQEIFSMRNMLFTTLAVLALTATVPASAQQVGEVGVDWLGNDIVVEAVKDPKVEGVTCHVSYFDRGVIDRLQKGNWFEEPSDTAISCQQTGPIKIGDIDLGQGGEEIFKQGISLIWKEQVVNRIYDKANDTLIYLAHSRQVQDGSAKMSMTTVPLFGQQVVWEKGKPQ